MAIGTNRQGRRLQDRVTADKPVYTPAGSVGSDTRNLGYPGGRTVAWGSPLYTDQNGGYVDAEGRPLGYMVGANDDSEARLAAANRAQFGGMARPGYEIPFDGDPRQFAGGFTGGFHRWLDQRKRAAADAKKNANNDPMSALEAFFNENYYDPSNDIRSAYGAQEAAINAEHDRLLARLGQEHGAAEAGVRYEGQQLQQQLGAIGADASSALRQNNRAIAQDYANAQQRVSNQSSRLIRDLQKQGVSDAGLKAEIGARRGSIGGAATADSAMGKRYSQMLKQEINNRKATGATVTTANVGDLARILQQSRDTAGTERLGAIAKLEASMASDLSQAKSGRASAKYELFLDAMKSGATLDQASTKLLKPSDVSSAISAGVRGAYDLSDISNDYLGDIDQESDEFGESGTVLGRINNSKDPIQETRRLYNTYLNNEDLRDDNPNIWRFLGAALGYGNTYTQAQIRAAATTSRYQRGLAAGGS